MKNNIKIISDFNTDVFYNLLSKKINKKKYVITKPSFGLFYEKCFELIQSKQKNHVVFVWSQIEAVLKNFNSLIMNEKVNLNSLNKEVDQYINILKQLAKKTDYLIVSSWVIPFGERGKYLNDYTDDFGLTKNLNSINEKVANELKLIKNFKLLNIDFWIKQNFSNPKLWYAAKIPYSQKTFELCSDEFVKIIDTLEGKDKKLIIVDLDNTLWGGILGDLGWKKLNIGGHNINGEAYKDFQIRLKSLKNLGIQLAICSKNEEKKALEAIENNQNMVLKKSDFASWRINWNDKAKNVGEIISELNLTNESVVFIDDNKAERERVKGSLKGVFVPDWPIEPSGYAEKIQSLGCFNLQHFTFEDKHRTKFYQDEKTRTENKEKFISYDKWLYSTKTKVLFEKGNSKTKKRILQLINKTNQMNLSTRRISENQLDLLINKKNFYLMSCKVKDKFGDMGLVGVISFKLLSNQIEIIDFILSCRAFGRSIEKIMLYKVIQVLKKEKISKIVFKYLKTSKNKPCLDFLKNNLKNEGKNIFVHSREVKFEAPKFLKVV